MHHPDLLSDIEDFLAKTEMGETYFGLKAANNPYLVKRLRGNGRVWPETADRVRVFMQKHGAPSPAKQGEAG